MIPGSTLPRGRATPLLVVPPGVSGRAPGGSGSAVLFFGPGWISGPSTPGADRPLAGGDCSISAGGAGCASGGIAGTSGGWLRAIVKEPSNNAVAKQVPVNQERISGHWPWPPEQRTTLSSPSERGSGPVVDSLSGIGDVGTNTRRNVSSICNVGPGFSTCWGTAAFLVSGLFLRPATTANSADADYTNASGMDKFVLLRWGEATKSADTQSYRFPGI